MSNEVKRNVTFRISWPKYDLLKEAAKKLDVTISQYIVLATDEFRESLDVRMK
tara:strand:- start:97 stop:255 length:159 start_codon:yes stop_codon:yes gene_type:complete